MGTIKQGILGGFSGKVAGVVGTSWKGIAVMKSLPLSVANPKTTAQVNNRNSFKGAAQFASSILTPIVKPLNDRFAVRESGYNRFLRFNKSAFDSSGDLIPENVKISDGTLSPIAGLAYDGGTAGESVSDLTFTNTISGSQGALTDKVYALAINTTSGEIKTSAGLVTRNDLSFSIEWDIPLVAGDKLYFYVAPLAADGRLSGPQATKVQIVDV